MVVRSNAMVRGVADKKTLFSNLCHAVQDDLQLLGIDSLLCLRASAVMAEIITD